MMIGEVTSFGELLRSYRLEAELTQADLAQLAGIGLETIGALERGVNNRPRKSTLARLCEALSLSGEKRAEFEDYARSLPRARRPASDLMPTNCFVCPFDCSSAPAPWRDLLAALCRHRR